MHYKYSPKINYEDYASGRVIYSKFGTPNFPIRILNELFERARYYCTKKNEIVIYDPCCGGGYSLTVLGFMHNKIIKTIYGSDIDESMLSIANKNLELLKTNGFNNRKLELENLYNQYQKESHREALVSINNLAQLLQHQIDYTVFHADATQKLPAVHPDIIITDIPYGDLVDWHGHKKEALDMMLTQLANISDEKTILAISMNKSQKIKTKNWVRLEKFAVGKRKFEILKKAL